MQKVDSERKRRDVTVKSEVVLTLYVTKSHGKLRQLRYLPEDLLGDQMHAPVLRPEVDLLLKPRRVGLDDSARRRSHVGLAVTATVSRQFERCFNAVRPTQNVVGLGHHAHRPIVC